MTRRLAPILLLLALAAACAGEDGPAGTGSAPATTASGPATTAPSAIEASLLEVFDGDTLLVSLDGAEEEVRLRGINAPEQDECFGDAARTALEGLLGSGPLRLDGRDERDQFGRLLAYAYAGDALLNLSLVEGGFALALQEDHPLASEFLQADQQAYAAGLGLWAADACGAAPQALASILDVEPNPPGPDEDDLNGEWVQLGNPAAQDADLSGWVLRDESSEHRYRFPAGTVLRPGEEIAVHTGCGRDGGGRLYWCQDGPVWNNGGDTALLLDPQGNVVGRRRYSA